MSAAATPTVSRAERRWQEALDEHRVALAAFLDTAGEIGPAEWGAPWKPGKWTRAQVAEHLTLSYEVVLKELRTGEGMQTRVPPWRQNVIRWIFLPHILFHRSIPGRPPSPREVRPGEPRGSHAEALARLRELGERFEQEIDRAFHTGGGSLTHPFFGRVDPVRAVRFVAVHAEHHRRQIAHGIPGAVSVPGA